MWKPMLVACCVLMLLSACGEGGSDTSSEDPDAAAADADIADVAEDAGTEQADDGSYSVEDELVCRANMEGLAMFLMHESSMMGSCPETLADLQTLSPAYASMEIVCCGVPYEYEPDGADFTLTCPNGHGNVVNEETSWQW